MNNEQIGVTLCCSIFVGLTVPAFALGMWCQRRVARYGAWYWLLPERFQYKLKAKITDWGLDK